VSTAWDLLIATRDAAAGPVDPDDLSLALAGAELLDLIGARAVSLEGDRIVPGPQATAGDDLLDQAARALVRQEPYETVDAWLRRRGDTLSSAYSAALETRGYAVRPRRRWAPLRTGRPELVDSPARTHAAERRASGEPVLAGLAAAVGVPGGDEGDRTDRRLAAEDDATAPATAGATAPATAGASMDDATATVLAAVGDAVTQLEAVRQRRGVEKAAYDNIWRAP
jgi:hypothetical protein